MILKKIVCSALLFFSFAAYAAQETSALDLTRLERLIPTEEQLEFYAQQQLIFCTPWFTKDNDQFGDSVGAPGGD